MTWAELNTADAASVYSCSSYSSGSRTFRRLRPPRNRARLRLKAAVPSKVYLPMIPLSESCKVDYGAKDGDRCQQGSKQVTVAVRQPHVQQDADLLPGALWDTWLCPDSQWFIYALSCT